jgi:aminoglycoside phosphotransferase (APT) family kinase protein
MPAAEWEIDDGLVRSLLAAQFPELADRRLTLLANGWDNVMYRLGDDLTVRLPRRDMAVALIDNEQRWLDELAPRLPLQVPVPVHCGARSERFPMPWSICSWFPGVLATDASFADPSREARRLGAFLTALHVTAPHDAPTNHWGRGQDARLLTPLVQANVDRIDREGLPSADAIVQRFEQLAAAEPHAGPPVWLHGDLHAANMLVDQGAISAVIDFGDITSGDPAVDLAIGWMVFDAPTRDEFRRAMPHVDDAAWARGAAWAVHFGILYLANSADNQRINSLGRRLLATMVESDSGEFA